MPLPPALRACTVCGVLTYFACRFCGRPSCIPCSYQPPVRGLHHFCTRVCEAYSRTPMAYKTLDSTRTGYDGHPVG